MTIQAFVAINENTYGGVYYTENFTLSGAITWSKLTTTGLANLNVEWFRTDPFDPTGRQYVMLANGDIYTRTSGNWTLVLDEATARTLAGAGYASATIRGLWIDRTVAGRVYSAISYYAAGIGTSTKVLKSVDYGANWSAIAVTGCAFYGAFTVAAAGDNIWVSANDAGIGLWAVFYSPDGGSTWRTATYGASIAYSDLQIDPDDGTRCYANSGADLVVFDDNGSSISITTLQNALDLMAEYNERSSDWSSIDMLWIDPETPAHALAMRSGTGTTCKLYETNDDWSNVVNASPADMSGAGQVPACVTMPENVVSDAVVFGTLERSYGHIHSLDSSSDTTPTNRSGANWNSAPYADSIPNQGTLARYGIWVGQALPESGIYFYGVEMGTPSTEAGRGIPLDGDRSARDALNYQAYHANDIDNVAGIHHTLGTDAGQASAGDHTHALANHDHSGDAGDGGTFDAANLTSGAASDGHVLTADGAGGAAWEAPGGGGDVATDAIWDAKGDLAAGTGANTAARVAVGSDGTYLKADSSQAAGVTWDTPGGSGDVLWSVIQALQAVNEIKNFPAMVGIDVDLDAQSQWWDKIDTPTTAPTMVDVAGEAGITETHEFAIKCVADAGGEGFEQRLTYADEPRVKSGRKLSTIAAVWVGTAGRTVTLTIRNSSGETTTATATAQAWTIIKAENHTLSGTYVDIEFTIDGADTFYVVPLGANIGEKAVPLPPRPWRWVQIDPVSVKSMTGLGDEATWTDIDTTANTSALAFRAELTANILKLDATGWDLAVRRNGSGQAFGPNLVAALSNFNGVERVANTFTMLLDDGQIFEYYLDRWTGASTLAGGDFYLNGWWEWA